MNPIVRHDCLFKLPKHVAPLMKFEGKTSWVNP